MLPPFRVRGLQRPASPGRAIQTKKAFDALVRISAREYDSTIRVCPEASLKYLDDDDGETITVGSSLELIQRLESPSLENSKYLPRVQDLLSSSDTFDLTESEPCSTAQNYHIFGIDCRVSSLEIWGEIQRRSKERGVILQPLNYPRCLETGAASKKEQDLLLLSNREHWEKTTSPNSSFRSVIADDVCADDLKVYVDESDDVSRLQELEDYRTARFQVGNPPRVKPSQSAVVSREQSIEHKSEMNRSVPENPSLASATAYGMCNLTLEGKRQAQAAGDKLRARTTHSRRKREIAASFDQAGYQNRWASYNDPTSSFHPGNLAGFDQLSNEPKLITEGKRQPQLAGDKLRGRTNPVRHVKSFRGPTDYGVNKNRRCGLAGSRVIHSSDRAESSTSTESLEAGTQGRIEMQPSLLQVFEAELAKLSSNPSPTECKEVITNLGLPVKRPLVPSSVEPHCPAEEAIRDTKTSSHGMGPMGPQPCVPVLELALRATLSTFGTCVTQIANCVQEVSTTMQVADKNQGIDIQVLDNAVASFRSFAEEIAALEKALHKEPELTEQSRAKTNRREDSSSLRDDQALKSSCTVILWPIPSGLESKEIQDILLLHTNQVKSVFISEASEESLRLAFCTVKDDLSAQIISHKMAGQMLNGNRLNVVVAPASEDDILREANDVSNKVTSKRHFSLLVLQNSPEAAPPTTTSLPSPAVETFGTIDAVEEPGQHNKPAATNLTLADHPKCRSASKSAKPVSLLSTYARSGNRFKNSNQLTDFVDTATQVDRYNSNTGIFPTDTGDLQEPLKDMAGTCPDLEKASILPVHNNRAHVSRYHESGRLHSGQDDVPVPHRSSSPQNQAYFKSRHAASHSGPLPFDEYADPKLGPPPVPPFPSAPDLCGRKFIRSSGHSLLNSMQSSVEDHLNSCTACSAGRVMSDQKTALRACRSTGTLFQHNDSIDQRQSQAGEFVAGKDRNVRASLGRNLSRMPSDAVCHNFYDKKTDFSNYGARSSTELKDFQASGSSSKVISLQDNTDVKEGNRAIHTSAPFSDQNALSGGLNQRSETPPLTSRFPTLEQFEGRHLDSASRFPTTPSTISLKDARPRAQSTGAQSLKSQDFSLSRAESTDFASSEVWHDEKRLNVIAPDTAESSGEFFNRMTRLACNSMTYHLPSTSLSERASTGSCVPVARKYPSQANIGTAYRNRSNHNVRRSVTTANLNGTLIQNNRRPYSENFSGRGRVAWDSFLHKDDKNMDNYPEAVAAAAQNQEALVAHNVFMGQPAFAFEDGEFDEAASEVQDVLFAGEHSDAASVRKVQECVSQLQGLGFGGDADGGIRRLVVYAQVAEGDLVGAIDMMDEEQRAYRERN